ncbi:MAG: hypothetical protein ABIP51_20855 [Bacteroidia bacterium]
MKFISIILLLLIIWGFISNLKFKKKFVIKKDHHYDNSIFFIKYFLFFKNRIFKFDISFDSTWDYILSNNYDQQDINKLIGFGFPPGVHTNSIRFGGRYNPLSKKVEILSYYYVNKVRGFELLYSDCLLDGTVYTLILEVNKKSYILSIEQNGKLIGTSFEIKKGHNQFFGYILKPYFGGNQAAPQLINTRISRVD